MPQLDDLISSTIAEIEEAKRRLKILEELKKGMSDGARVSTEEAARQLGQGVRTIPVWCLNGKLDGVKVGRRWMVSQESIDRMLEAR